jgi:hypothetical protein
MTLEELKSWKCPKCGGTTGAAEEGGVGGTAKVCACEKTAPVEPLLTKAEAKDFDFEGSDEYAELRRARHVRSGGRY